MSYIPILLVGSCDDGPDGVPILPDTLEEAQNLFGWQYDEHKLLTVSGSSTTLSYPVWGSELKIYKRYNGKLYPNSLYRPIPSGSVVTFGAPGASGDYIFRYIRTPAEDNLITSLSLMLEQGADIPYLYRVPGIKASVVINDLTLTAQYSGWKYNGITIIVSGSHLIIRNPNSDSFVDTTYSTSNLFSMTNTINTDCARNKHPIKATYKYTNNAPATGTYVLSGGSNGSLDSSNLSNILDSIDIDETGLIVLLGGQPSGVVNSSLSYLENNNPDNATCMIAGSPLSMKDSTDYTNYLNNLPFASNRLFYVPGWGKSSVVYGESYWFSLLSIFAGLWSGYSSSPTHKVTTIEEISPFWEQGELTSLGEKYPVFTKFIQSGLSPFRSCPTNGENPLINKVKIDISRRVGDKLDSLVGEPIVDLEIVYNLVDEALANLDNVKEIKYNCYLESNTITVIIYVIVYGETEFIELSLSTRRPDNE